MTNTKESTIKVVRDERGRFVKPTPTPRPFKVGDVVRRVLEDCEVPIGSIGVIHGPSTNTKGFYFVNWNSGHQKISCNPKYLELVPNAPKQRKAEKKAEAPKFKVGDRVAHTYTKENDPGIIKRIKGDKAFVKWEVDHQQWNLIENLYHFPEPKKPENLVLSVPEEIPAALQTLAKAFGYRVEKA